MADSDTAYSIRIAVPADEARIRDLFAEMLRTISKTDTAEGYESGYLDKFWTGREDRIYAAETDKVVAYLSVEVYRRPRAYVYLDDFSVTAAYRGRGIGTALLRAAEAYAKSLGMPAVVLHVDKSNDRAYRFYEGKGFSVYRDDGDRHLMKKDLG